MAFSTIVVEEGQRNLVLQVIGTSADAAGVLVDVSALNPPCQGVRLMRVSYDVEPTEKVLLEFDGGQDLLTLSEGSGQTICYKKVGGIPNRNAGGSSNGDVLITSSDGKYSMTLHFAKQNPLIPR